MSDDRFDMRHDPFGAEESPVADDLTFRWPDASEFTRADIVRYGLIGGATVFFMGAGSAKAARWAAPPKPAKTPDSITVRNWGDPWRSFYRDNVAKGFTAQTGVEI